MNPVDDEQEQEQQDKATHTPAGGTDADLWAEMDALRREIDRAWKSDKSAVELVSEQRR